MRIAVDFDGTIVENRYPDIGKPMLFAFETLKALQEKKHLLILWTYRSGQSLDDAVEYCRENGIEFYAVNHSHPEDQNLSLESFSSISRKIDADVFIDDRNIGGFLGWSKIWQLIHPESGELDLQFINQEAHNNYPKPSFWSRLLGKANDR